jgi:hypothetical protein
MDIRKIVSNFATIWGFLALAIHAQAIFVQDTGVSPSETVTISVTNFYAGDVYAGINNLLVDGVAMKGFCIDPFHFSQNSQGYNFVPLADAPKEHLMGAAKAEEISKLWAMDYSPLMTAPQAAGLQIAIWEIVGGSDFSLVGGSDYGASVLLEEVADYSGDGASLIALTGPGQDYCVQVPDSGTTLSFLAMTLLCLVSVRGFRKISPQPALCRSQAIARRSDAFGAAGKESRKLSA